MKINSVFEEVAPLDRRKECWFVKRSPPSTEENNSLFLRRSPPSTEAPCVQTPGGLGAGAPQHHDMTINKIINIIIPILVNHLTIIGP